MALAEDGRHHVRRSVMPWKRLQEIDSGPADRTQLRTAFGIAEADALCFGVNPVPGKREDFHPPASREQQQSDRREPNRRLAGSLSHQSAKHAYFVKAKKPALFSARQFFHAAGEVLFDYFATPGEFQDHPSMPTVRAATPLPPVAMPPRPFRGREYFPAAISA